MAPQLRSRRRKISYAKLDVSNLSNKNVQRKRSAKDKSARNTARRKTGFTDLPCEIRQTIYQYLWQDRQERIDQLPDYSGRPGDIDLERVGATECMKFSGLWSLAQSSRVIYQEAIWWLYRGLTFRLSDFIPPLERFVASLVNRRTYSPQYIQILKVAMWLNDKTPVDFRGNIARVNSCRDAEAVSVHILYIGSRRRCRQFEPLLRAWSELEVSDKIKISSFNLTARQKQRLDRQDLGGVKYHQAQKGDLQSNEETAPETPLRRAESPDPLELAFISSKELWDVAKCCKLIDSEVVWWVYKGARFEQSIGPQAPGPLIPPAGHEVGYNPDYIQTLTIDLEIGTPDISRLRSELAILKRCKN
ncbi:hypothetical protein ANO11243_051480 [Dothideomycetidae sp. 11243]|nr:hypothetical protein ANO11243_051480 [fungal sp. No.11243]